LIGALLAGVALATVLAMFLVGSGKFYFVFEYIDTMDIQ
jgi:hypothetical protein